MSLRLLVTALGDVQGRVFPYDFDDDRAQILLGRRGGVDVLLPHAGVSLVHARIERRGAGYVIVDDGSTNGTSVNGVRLDPGAERPLRQGDRIGIAEFTLEVAEAQGGPGGSVESSISVARRMVAEVLGVLGPGQHHPTLVVEGGDGASGRLEIAQPGRPYVIGRGGGCDLELGDVTVARRHVRVERGERGDVIAADMGSHCGLYVNDRYVTGDRALRDGDVLAVGRVRLRFTDPADVYLRRLEQLPPGATAAPLSRAPATVSAATPAPAAPAPESASRKSELAVVAVAATLGLLAAAALLYLWLT